jgi:hypothetical protein
LAENSAFVDANKRTAFHEYGGVLAQKWRAFAPSTRDSHTICLATGEISEDSLGRWIRDSWPKE